MRTPSERVKKERAVEGVLTMEVQIQQNRAECWVYTWDRERGRLCLSGKQPGSTDLLADLAFLHLEKQIFIPVSILTSLASLAPGTFVTVRILGAYQVPLPAEIAKEADPFPLAGWNLVAVPAVAELVPSSLLLEQFRAALRARYAAAPDDLVWDTAATVAQRLREARVWLKRRQRQQAPVRTHKKRGEEEGAVAWRAVEGLTPEQRTRVGQAATLTQLAAFLQPEQVIRFVPQRFQEALSRLLLDDERVLAFLERPLLRHRRGWPGSPPWRANAGLLLVTDRQVLWVRDFFSPGSLTLPAGFHARSVPLERLMALSLVPAGVAASSRGLRLSEERLPYPRLVLAVESRSGREFFEVAFPLAETTEQALARLVPLLRAFLPAAGQPDRRVRRLPVIASWMPQGTEARHLDKLGGVVPDGTKQFLTAHFAHILQTGAEEVLVSGLVPELAEYQSPPRLVALTRTAVLVLEAVTAKTRWMHQSTREPLLRTRRYELADLSSVQISYSLLGSHLSLYIPQADGTTRQQTIPFQSPALTWVLPLFTCLRLALSLPYQVPPAPDG